MRKGSVFLKNLSNFEILNDATVFIGNWPSFDCTFLDNVKIFVKNRLVSLETVVKKIFKFLNLFKKLFNFGQFDHHLGKCFNFFFQKLSDF